MTITLSYPPNTFYSASIDDSPSPEIVNFKVNDKHLNNPEVFAHIINRIFQEIYARNLQSDLEKIKVTATMD